MVGGVRDSCPLAGAAGGRGVPEGLTNRQINAVELAVRQGFEF